MSAARFKRGERVRYSSGMGAWFSARVTRVHSDGDYTIQVRFRLDGERERACFHGDVYRVRPDHLWPWPEVEAAPADLAA